MKAVGKMKSRKKYEEAPYNMCDSGVKSEEAPYTNCDYGVNFK